MSAGRWHGARGVGWIAPVVTFVVLAIMSVLFEGFLLIPLGIYQMSGAAPFAFMGNHDAAKNIVSFALAFTAAGAVGYYRNDRGETYVERVPRSGRAASCALGRSLRSRL